MVLKNSAVKPYLRSETPLAIAHRGYSTDGLENSLKAFRSALELGFLYLETDINSTADGVAVVFHDHTLDRTTNQNGTISELPWSRVRTARIGGREPIVTLQEFFAALPTARFNIDVKDAGAVPELVDAIERLGLHDRVCIASFSDKRRRQVQAGLSRPVASSPGQSLLVMYFLLEGWLPKPLLRLLMRRVDVLQIPLTHKGLALVTAAKVRRAQRLGLKVHVWTINDAAQMQELLELGVDGIMTDRADLLADIMRQRGHWA